MGIKEGKKPAQEQFYNVPKKTPETFIKQLGINGKKSTIDSKFMDPSNTKDVSVKRRGGGSVR